jgi:hypothetical protein
MARDLIAQINMEQLGSNVNLMEKIVGMGDLAVLNLENTLTESENEGLRFQVSKLILEYLEQKKAQKVEHSHEHRVTANDIKEMRERALNALPPKEEEYVEYEEVKSEESVKSDVARG